MQGFDSSSAAVFYAKWRIAAWVGKFHGTATQKGAVPVGVIRLESMK